MSETQPSRPRPVLIERLLSRAFLGAWNWPMVPLTRRTAVDAGDRGPARVAAEVARWASSHSWFAGTVAATLVIIEWLGAEMSVPHVGPYVSAAIRGERAIVPLIVFVYGSSLTWVLLGARSKVLARLQTSIQAAKLPATALNGRSVHVAYLKLAAFSAVAAGLYAYLGRHTPTPTPTREVQQVMLASRHWLFAGILLACNAWSLMVFLLWTVDGNLSTMHALRVRRPLLADAPDFYAAVSDYQWVSAISALTWSLYVIGVFVSASWVETGHLASGTLSSLGSSVALLVILLLLVGVFFALPFLSTGRLLSSIRADQRQRVHRKAAAFLRTEEGLGRASDASEMEAALRLVNEIAPRWPLPIDRARAALIGVLLPMIAVTINVGRVAISLGPPK